jgi:tRNA A-37 threonylcarbamoyl transferase component Bud32
LTEKIERKIYKAFDAIHSHDVVHGDIRSANILVDEERKLVWIVDFEFATILMDGSEDKDVRILRENMEIQRVLREIKKYG